MSEPVGHVSIDGGAIAIVDAMYLMTDKDHDAARDEGEVVRGYDAAHVPVAQDGVFPVYVERDAGGQAVAIRIDLRP
jgi:hypothetical protein